MMPMLMLEFVLVYIFYMSLHQYCWGITLGTQPSWV